MELQFKTFDTANDFIAENLDFLEREEAINSLMIGLGILMKDRTLIENEVLISVKRADQIVLVALQSGYNIILAGDQDLEYSTLWGLSAFLKKMDIQIPGVLGLDTLSKHFAKAYTSLFDLDFKIKFEQCVFQLDQVLPFGECEGFGRKANQDDLGILETWIHEFLIEAMDDDDSAKAKTITETKLKNGELYLWIVHNRPVCLTAKARPTRHGISVNYVYTPKEFRGHGYATNLVGQVSQIQLEDGYQFCTLFTDRANPTSNKIYRSLGYTQAGYFSEIKFSHK